MGDGLPVLVVGDAGDEGDGEVPDEVSLIVILSPKKPAEVTLDGKTLVESTDWRYDAADQRLWVTTKSYSDGRYRIAFAK